MENYRKCLIAVCFALLFTSFSTLKADAAILYVSTTGNDSNSGAQNSPVATVRQAFLLASSGDTIYIRGGRYTLSRYLYVDKANLTFSSAPGESATLVGSN